MGLDFKKELEAILDTHGISITNGYYIVDQIVALIDKVREDLIEEIGIKLNLEAFKQVNDKGEYYLTIEQIYEVVNSLKRKK